VCVCVCVCVCMCVCVCEREREREIERDLALVPSSGRSGAARRGSVFLVERRWNTLQGINDFWNTLQGFKDFYREHLTRVE